MSLCDTVRWKPQALRGWSPGKGQDLEHPTSAICPIMALPRLLLPPARFLQPNLLPLHTDLPHTRPLLTDVPRCIFIPAKATEIPFCDHRRVPVLFPHLHPNSCFYNPEVLHTELGHHSGFSGPASRVEPPRSFTSRGTGTQLSLFHLQQLGHPAERPAVCPHRLTCQGSLSGSEMRTWQQVNTTANRACPHPLMASESGQG